VVKLQDTSVCHRCRASWPPSRRVADSSHISAPGARAARLPRSSEAPRRISAPAEPGLLPLSSSRLTTTCARFYTGLSLL